MQILDKLKPLGLLILRLGVAAVFLATGYDKLFGALGIGLDEVREVARKAAPRIKSRLSVPLMAERGHSPRPVVVEYRAAKRLVAAR